jgi:hypothetical protein
MSIMFLSKGRDSNPGQGPTGGGEEEAEKETAE